MSKVTFDYSKAASFIGAHEVDFMKKTICDARDVLVSKTGAGNDFLGWIDLPVDYDKEEFARIKKAAAKIQSDSEVLLVIGIGGSYLGARAAIEFLRHSFYNSVSKEIRKDQEISIESMAELLGVSATPVREAYQILAQEGLIKLRPNKGAIVIGLSEQWVKDHYGVRAALEAEAARLVAENNSDISELERIVVRSGNLIENGDYSAYADLNQAFHVAIWKLSGNQPGAERSFWKWLL